MKMKVVLVLFAFACGGPQPDPLIHPGTCGLPREVEAGELRCMCFNCAQGCGAWCEALDGGACQIVNPDGGTACE